MGIAPYDKILKKQFVGGDDHIDPRLVITISMFPVGAAWHD